MSQGYKRLTGIDLIKGFCAEILAYGIREGLDLYGIKIWMPPQLIKSLELGDFLSVEHENCIFEIPIVESDSKETPLGDGGFQVDIFAGNPEWEIGRAEGELCYEPNI
jgi:hypothetical protein